MSQKTNIEHKLHFEALDGLRGVAAMTVVLYHYGLAFGGRYVPAHGYLAVDFFFALSGFVLVHAYRDKLRRGAMSVGQFVRARLIRLWPLLALATLAAFLLRMGLVLASHPAGDDNPAKLTADLILGGLLLPELWPVHDPSRVVFPLNFPSWSIFHELAINFAWAIVAVRWGWRRQAVAALVCLPVLAAFAMRTGGVDCGFAQGFGFVVAFFRVALSFNLGLLCHRVYRAVPPSASLGFVAVAAVLAGLLWVPILPFNAGYDLVAILLPFPALILVGSRVVCADWMAGLVRWLGLISFPVYAIHYLVLRAALSGAEIAGLPRPGPGFILPCAAVALALAWIVHHGVDLPARRALGRSVDGWLGRAGRVGMPGYPN